MKKTIFCLLIILASTFCNQPKINQIREFASPASDSCAQPYLFNDKNGTVYLTWIEKLKKQSTLKFSSIINGVWTKPISIAKGNNWFVNWADYPIIAADGKNNLIANYLEKSDTAKFAYDVKYTTSVNNGNTWTQSKILHNDEKLAEHGFVSMMPYDENFFISWLDGRNTISEKAGTHNGHQGEMTIRGAILTKEGIKEKEWELDNRVCDCCQTSVAITDNGPVVVYRDRSEDEIRDMAIVRLVNGKWTVPKIIFPDGWKIMGCPVNGPKVDAIGNNLAIAWFSINDNKGQVKIIFSLDGGESFGTPIQIDEGTPIGRVDLLMLDEKSAFVSWMEGSDIKALKVNSNGIIEKSIMVATSSDARASGFPQITKSRNKIFFAWTDEKEKRIKTAMLDFK